MDAPIEHAGSAYTGLLETLEARRFRCGTRTRPHHRSRRRRDADAAVAARPADPRALEGEREQRGRAARLPRAGRAVRGRCRAGDRTLVAVAAVAAAGAHPQGRAPRRPLLVDGAVPGRGAAGGWRWSRWASATATGTRRPRRWRRLEKIGARVLRTDQDGTITIVTDGTRIDVSTERGRHALLSPPPP